jgi:DNA-binding transcriptional MerR regulator
LNRLYSKGDRTRLALILKGKKLGFTLGEIRQMIAVEEGDADPDTLTLSREKCLEQIELLKRQKEEVEEGLNELFRIYASLTEKIADGDRRAR